MKRSSRLTRNDVIKHVRKEGITFARRTIVLGLLPNQLGKNRVAVIAGRSVGGAVQRNLAKRQLRSAYKTFQSELNEGFDIVLIARRPILKANYASQLNEMRLLLEQAGLMKERVR